MNKKGSHDTAVAIYVYTHNQDIGSHTERQPQGHRLGWGNRGTETYGNTGTGITKQKHGHKDTQTYKEGNREPE